MIGTIPATKLDVIREEITRVADDILDFLQVTDRVYHHIDFTKPLVLELAVRLRVAQAAPARVLIVGSDSLLTHLLLQLGYSVDLWHFAQGHLTDDLFPYIRETVTPEQLAKADLPLPDEPYDAIVLPLILESLPGDGKAFLTRLRQGLRPDGRLILATTNVSRLDIRLRSLLGLNPATAYPKFQVSLSFPPLPRLRYLHRDELLTLAQRAGFQVHECSYVITHAACSTIDPFPPGPYAMLQAGQAVMQLIPPTRHAILLDLTPRVAAHETPDPRANGDPRVSVIVSHRRDENALRETLTALIDQDYPSDCLEVIVLHDGDSDSTSDVIREISGRTAIAVRELILDIPEGPAARNAAMRAAAGDICAHTDDACRIPLGWVRTIAAAFDDSTGVVAGPVVEIPNSHPDFLVLPGSRVGWDPQTLYPIFNVAYRRQPALASGGFDADANERDPLPFGWDTELAWRLNQQGWDRRFVKDMFLFRSYDKPKSLTWPSREWQLAQDLPRAVSRVPGLAEHHLTMRWFASWKTFTFDLLVVGFVAALLGRRRKYLLLSLPWIGYYSKFIDLWPATRWRGNVRLMVQLATRHVVWLGGLIRGSLKARRLVL
ncbi:MAG TPA: glycosyltransferase [Chloroflexota bacterium]|nr:glycosyltransferase [Chloroflexota bacterium]